MAIGGGERRKNRRRAFHRRLRTPLPRDVARRSSRRRPRRAGALRIAARPQVAHRRLPGEMNMSASKLMTLAEMVERVPNGASLALGGSFLHRGPFAFVRELIRQGKKDLEIIKQ